jgi:hypothetical protein
MEKTDDYKKTIYSNGKQAFVFDCAHSWILKGEAEGGRRGI